MVKVREEELVLCASEASQQIIFKLPDSENATVHGISPSVLSPVHLALHRCGPCRASC